MPPTAFAFQLVLFLRLVQVLGSLPTEGWREERKWGYPEWNGSRGHNFGGQLFQVRSLVEAAVEGYLGGTGSYGNDNSGTSYSSHVKCGADERLKNARTNVDASRLMRSDAARDAEVPNPRIVTPKGGRRPGHGNAAQNESKPLNAISTTEKAVGAQPAKGPKRPRPGGGKPPPGGDIIFPDGFHKRFVPRVTTCPKKSTFCENLGEEYPGEYISQVLKKEGAMFREFFGRDVISDPNITERINAPEENSLCPYRQEVVFPRAAQNKEDKWLFIVNQEQYVQGVTVEVCLNPDSRCILTEGFPLGYTPYCKQKYIERRLVAIGEDGKPHSDSFRLPSCCSCVVKHDASARMSPLRPSGRGSIHP